MRIVFHIGMGKTGTSSIQHELQNSPKELAKQNVAYLGLWFNAIDPAFRGYEGFHRFTSQTDAEKIASADEFLSYLADCAAKESIETFIFSNESLFTAGPLLEPFFERLKEQGLAMSFVAYMRDPRAWLPSAHTQWSIRHKANKGPVQDFPTAARRLIEQYEGIRFWQQSFGDVLTSRPFVTRINVVQDFASTVGVVLAETDTRKMERAEAADILLRAMFNTRFSGQIMPDMFDRLVTNSSLAPVPSLLEMAERCFNHDAAEEVIKEKRDLFDYIRDYIGLDLLDGEPQPTKITNEAELQRRVIDYLVEVTFDQARRLKRLERLVNELNTKVSGA